MILPRNTRCVIVTHERAVALWQTTLRAFIAAKIRPLELIIQESQEEAYCRMLTRMEAPWVSVTVMPAAITGIAKTRQWIVDTTYEAGQQNLLMFDDDLSFATRWDTDGHYKVAKPSEVQLMICTMISALEHFAHTGIAIRNLVGYPSVKAQVAKHEAMLVVERQIRALGYRVDVLKELRVRYHLDFVDDFDMTLTLFDKGYPNAVFYDWYQGERKGFEAPGGCAMSRTPRALRRVQRLLALKFPDAVKFRERTYKGTRSRTELQIQWKKAYRGTPLSQRQIVRYGALIRKRAKSMWEKHLRRPLARSSG